MSRDKVATIRALYDRWSVGDFTASVDLFDPQVVFVIPPGFPDSGTYVGNDEIAAYTRGFLEPWTRITINSEELVPAGDSVLATVLQRGVGDASGAATEFRYYQLWSLRGDKVIRLENFRDREEAREAAGLAR
jgi:ketosteroid isomerase-like protein